MMESEVCKVLEQLATYGELLAQTVVRADEGQRRKRVGL